MQYRYLRFPEGKAKAVTFSFDDGVRHDIKHAEMMSRYGLKCTYNINTAMYGKDETSRRLTQAEVKKYLFDAGHEIAIHGANHIAPGVASSTIGIKDTLECRLALEKDFGCIIRGMAYPDCGITRFHNGTTKEQVKNYLKALGIVYARSLYGDNNRFELPEDFLEWIPTVDSCNPKIMEYIDEFLTIDYKKDNTYAMLTQPKLFFVWGHSFAYGDDDTWEKWEEICQKLAHQEEVWYATNIEIYEYVKAYQSLVFSADESMVYNPTLKTVWFEVDKKLYYVLPGEMVLIG